MDEEGTRSKAERVHAALTMVCRVAREKWNLTSIAARASLLLSNAPRSAVWMACVRVLGRLGRQASEVGATKVR